MNKEERLYTTTDFYTVALLISQKYEVIKITREGPQDKDGEGRTRRFYFEDTHVLRENILDFMNNKLEGKLKDFKDAIETTKDLIHS